jgi:hypothetical protein
VFAGVLGVDTEYNAELDLAELEDEYPGVSKFYE